jgi:predicted lactoylglutathione lyase
MELGAFSVSLNVKDLEASKSFYEKFGFQVFGGDAAHEHIFRCGASFSATAALGINKEQGNE